MSDKGLELRRRLIDAGEKAVEELIQVAEHKIDFVVEKPKASRRGKSKEEEEYQEEVERFAIAADKLKTAAQAKKIAIMDAFEILAKVQAEREVLASLEKKKQNNNGEVSGSGGFAEKRARDKS